MPEPAPPPGPEDREEVEALEAEPLPPAGPGAPAATPAAAGESAADLRDRWLRAEAELQNYRRRARRDAEEGRRAAEERVMLEIIGALDDLDRALAAMDPAAPESWAAGVRLVAQRLREFLAREGVTTLDPMGRPFDPTLHEAVLEMDAPEGASPGQVVQVVLKGYARGGRALRPARVVVARARRAAER